MHEFDSKTEHWNQEIYHLYRFVRSKARCRDEESGQKDIQKTFFVRRIDRSVPVTTRFPRKSVSRCTGLLYLIFKSYSDSRKPFHDI
jgi:hypothetical protein